MFMAAAATCSGHTGASPGLRSRHPFSLGHIKLGSSQAGVTVRSDIYRPGSPEIQATLRPCHWVSLPRDIEKSLPSLC